MLTQLPSVSAIAVKKQGDIRRQRKVLAIYTRNDSESLTGVTWDCIQRRGKASTRAQATPPVEKKFVIFKTGGTFASSTS